MIQFNLLPDVKQQYLKARRTRQLVFLISFIVSAVALTILILLFVSVKVVQQKSMRDADKDITKYSKQLTSIKGLNEVLTVQNQLNSLTGLHDGKVLSSRTFNYLKQLTPSTVSIGNLTLDYTLNTATITGTAATLDQVNVYVDTIKQTTFKTSSDTTKTNAFSDVVLTQFSRNDKNATFTMTFGFKPDIFSIKNDVTLSVPNIVTSPEQILFQKVLGN